MVQMGRVKRKGRKRDQEGESTQLVESYTQPAGGSFENGERMNGERVSGGVILKGSNHFDDTQLVEDPIDGDRETQLAFCTNSHAYPSIEHDTGIQTQLVDEPENADCLEPRDSENEGTEIIGSPSSEGGSSSCQHFACQDGNTARDVTAYSEGMNALNIDVKITVTSRSLSAHMDKKVADSDASTEDGNNLDSGPPEVNSASVHAIPHKVTSHSPHVERYPKRHVFQADSEKAEVWDRYSGKVEIDNPKVENSVEENTRNTLPSNDAGKIVDDVTSLHVHTIEQPSELKYLCSEEPGELSQANALEVVDKLLGFDDIEHFPDDRSRKNVEVKLSSISGAKGPQSLARRQDRNNPMDSIGLFDWIDSREDEGGGAFFTRKRKSFFGGGKEKKFTEPCKVKKRSTREDECLAIGSHDHRGRLIKDHDILSLASCSDSREGLLASKSSLHFEQVDKSKIKRNLLSHLNEQAHTQILEQSPEPAKDNDTSFNDVGIDTQMAAEAMEALGHLSPVIKLDENVSSLNQKVNNGKMDGLAKLPDKRVAKKVTMRKSSKGSHDVGSDYKKDSEKFSEFPESGGKSGDAYGFSGLKEPCMLTEPVAHRTRTRFAKTDHKCCYFLRNQKEGSSDKIGVRIPRRTRSSLSGDTSFKKQVSTSTAPFQCKGNDSFVIAGRLEKGSMEGNPRSSSQNKRAKICSDTCENGKDKCIKQTRSVNADTVKVTKRPSSPVSSLLPTFKQYPLRLNVGVPFDNGNTPCCPYDGDETRSSRHSRASTFKKSKKDSNEQKDSIIDTIQAGCCLSSDVELQKMPSTLQAPAIPNCPHGIMTMSTTVALQNDVQIKSSSCVTPLKNHTPVSPSSKMKGTALSCNSKRSSMSPLTKELIRLDAIDPELSPILKDVARKKKDICNVRVLFSHHLSEDIIKQQQKILARMGISTASSALDATHFIADKFVRTRNMLESIALGKPIVTPSWLESCGQACCFIDEKKYILRDAKKEREIGFSMSASLARAKDKPLLQDRKVLVTQNVKPSKDLIIALVKAAQGLVSERIGRSATEDLLVISCEEDRSICMPFLESGKKIRFNCYGGPSSYFLVQLHAASELQLFDISHSLVWHTGARAYSAELILNGIVIQNLEFDRHLLFMDGKRTRSSRTLRN